MIQVPDNLIKFAVATVLTMAAARQIPRFNHYVRFQTAKLLESSQSSGWGKGWIPNDKHKQRH